MAQTHGIYAKVLSGGADGDRSGQKKMLSRAEVSVGDWCELHSRESSGALT